jgi:hypothetical protein
MHTTRTSVGQLIGHLLDHVPMTIILGLIQERPTDFCITMFFLYTQNSHHPWLNSREILQLMFVFITLALLPRGNDLFPDPP